MHGEDFETYRARVPRIFPDATLFAGFRTVGKDFTWRRVTWGEIWRLFRFAFVGTLLVVLQYLVK